MIKTYLRLFDKASIDILIFVSNLHLQYIMHRKERIVKRINRQDKYLFQF